MSHHQGLTLICAAFVFSACSPQSREPLSPTVQAMPGPSKSSAEFQNDQTMCKQYAESQIDWNDFQPRIRVNNVYTQCMDARGDIILGYNLIPQMPPPSPPHLQSYPLPQDQRRPPPVEPPKQSYVPNRTPNAGPETALITPDQRQPGEANSPSEASGVFRFKCEDGSTIVIDLARKTVRATAVMGPYRCEDTIVDGVEGPITTPAACNVPVMREFTASVIVKQSVKVNGNVVRWDGKVVGEPAFRAASQTLQLGQDINLRTGQAHDMDGNTGSCRRLSP